MLDKNSIFFEVSLSYVYIGLFLSRISYVDEFSKSLLALPMFFLLPFLAGMVLLELAKVLLDKQTKNTLDISDASYFILCLLTGIFFTEFSAVILQIFNLSLLLKNIGYLMLSVITLGFLYFRFSRPKIKFGRSFEVCVKNHIMPILLILGFNVAAFLVKASFVRAPLTTWSSWGNPIAHVQAVLRLLNRGFFDVTQRWMEILLTAISCQLFNISYPEFFSYAGTLLVTTMLSLGTFALALRLSSNTRISLLCGILSIFLNAPIGFHEVPAYHFKANTILIGLSPWILLLVIDLLNKQRINNLESVLTLTIPVGLFILGLAFLSGTPLINTFYSYGISYEAQLTLVRPIIIITIPLIALTVHVFLKNRVSNVAILLLASAVLYTTNEWDAILHISVILLFIIVLYVITKRNGHMQLRIASLLIFMIIFLAWNNVITLPDIPISPIVGIEKPFTTSNFVIKKIVFSDGNSLITQYFFVLGLMILIFSRAENDLLVLGALTVAFSLYFFPDYWLIRALGATTPLMAFAISKNLDFISKTVRSVFARKNRTKVVTTFILASLFVVVIASNLLNPLYLKFSKFPDSRLAPYEYDVAIWLRENTKETEVIISDYWTMMLLNPISNKIWLTERQYMAESLDSGYIDLLAELRSGVFKASSSWEAYNKIQTLAEEMRVGIDWTERYYYNYIEVNPENITFLIVLSSRTAKWLETESMDIMEPQYSTVNSSYVMIFNDTRYFTPLTHISEQVYVFRVRL